MSSVPQDFDVKCLKDRNYKGDDFNIKQELGQGPFSERKCTDLACCLFFTVFLGGMATLTVYGYINGDVNKLMSPIDSDGNICGVTPGYTDYPYLFIADISQAASPTTNIFDYGVCVKECPSTAVASQSLECKPTGQTPTCTLSTDDQYGATYLFDYCMPIYDTLAPSIQDDWQTLTNSFADSKSGGYLVDIYDARWVIVGGVAIAVAFTFGYIKFMDWCAFWIAWFSVILLELFFIGAGVGTWMVRSELMNNDDTTDDDYNDHLFWSAIVSWILGGFYLLFVVCNWKSLKVSIAIIETAADFFADTKRIVLVPLCYFGVALVIFGTWLGATICVNSIGDITVSSIKNQTKDVDHSA